MDYNKDENIYFFVTSAIRCRDRMQEVLNGHVFEFIKTVGPKYNMDNYEEFIVINWCRGMRNKWKQLRWIYDTKGDLISTVYECDLEGERELYLKEKKAIEVELFPREECDLIGYIMECLKDYADE